MTTAYNDPLRDMLSTILNTETSGGGNMMLATIPIAWRRDWIDSA